MDSEYGAARSKMQMRQGPAPPAQKVCSQASSLSSTRDFENLTDIQNLSTPCLQVIICNLKLE